MMVFLYKKRVVTEKAAIRVKKPGLFLAGVVMAFLVLWIWRANTISPVIYSAEQYITALACKDTAAIEIYGTGSAALLAKQLPQSQGGIKVDSIQASIETRGSGWARLMLTVELTLGDGTPDVGWYTVDMVKSDGFWRVSSLRERLPEVPGKLLPLGTKAEEGLQQAFEGYVEALINKQYEKAVVYLAGPAKKSHELSQPALKKGMPFRGYSELHCQGVFRGGRMNVVKATYMLDGEKPGEKYKAEVLIYGFQTNRGWRIVDLNTL